jgi:hypothetical protein
MNRSSQKNEFFAIKNGNYRVFTEAVIYQPILFSKLLVAQDK